MKKLIFLLIFFPFVVFAQNLWFYMNSFWEVGWPGMSYNIESFDMDKNGKLDVISGNWNDTYVYYGGYGILDTAKDLIYKGRMLAICDYNGDGFEDMVSMHFTGYDSSRYDYDGELLFYWGNNTTTLAIDTIPDYSIPLPTLYPNLEWFTKSNFTVGVQKGDLNGDGKTDLLFRSRQSADSGHINLDGKLYIYIGKEIPSDTADFILKGENPLALIGDYARIGNINGDDFDDFLFSSDLTTTIGVSFDSVNYLHIFYGSENFSAVQGNESKLYASRVNPRDSTAGWFLRQFSVDDINGDGIDDIVVGRTFYNYPHQTVVHYGSINGIDTIPSFTFIEDTSNPVIFSAGGVTQDIGDYNMDGYDDFIISPAGYQLFALHFGGPYISNGNRYGQRGYTKAAPIFPVKSINMGDQTNDGVNDIAVLGPSYILMLYGRDIPTEIKEPVPIPQGFKLHQNYPNPFNPVTTIKYNIPQRCFVTIKVYDVIGNEIRTLVNDEKSIGSYETEFNAPSLSSGVYFYRIRAGNPSTSSGQVFMQTKKMILLK